MSNHLKHTGFFVHLLLFDITTGNREVWLWRVAVVTACMMIYRMMHMFYLTVTGDCVEGVQAREVK